MGIGCICRYLADLNFDKARKLATSYGRSEVKLTSRKDINKLKSHALININYYLDKAIYWNILEKENYIKKINKFYLQEIFR
jgi:hypothetical protein